MLRRVPSGKIETLVQDDRLQWPDTCSLTADGTFYVVSSSIQKTLNWTKGVDQPCLPVRILNMALPEQAGCQAGRCEDPN